MVLKLGRGDAYRLTDVTVEGTATERPWPPLAQDVYKLQHEKQAEQIQTRSLLP